MIISIDVMAYRDIPHYTQLSNTCGLSSLLMIANPEGNSLEFLLTDIAKLIPFGSYQRALRWQIAEAYLLMKCCGNRVLQYHLRKQFHEEYSYYRIILFHQLQERFKKFQRIPKKLTNLNLFLRRGIIRKDVFKEYVFEMKTNLELKMLAYLFGGTPILYPSNDGTGCIILDGNNTKEKLQMLFHYIPHGVLLGSAYHWNAVRGMEPLNGNKYKILLHDPLGYPRSMTTDQIGQNNRFYIFQFNAAKRKDMDKIVRRALNLPRSAFNF